MRGDTESLVTEIVGDDLHGERVLNAVVCTTRRSYIDFALLLPYASATGARGDERSREAKRSAVRRSSVLAQATGGFAPTPRKSEDLWYLALTDTRVLIVSALRITEPRGHDWRATRNVLMPRGDVVVERFRRAGPTSWALHLNVRTQGRWVLRSVSLIPGIGFGFTQARQIAQALGWLGLT